MNKIMLINRLNPQDHSEEKRKTFFTIGGMNLSSIDNKIIDILNSIDVTKSSDLVFKYNGIELNITTQQIPKILKALCEGDILVYGVYQLYDPDL